MRIGNSIQLLEILQQGQWKPHYDIIINYLFQSVFKDTHKYCADNEFSYNKQSVGPFLIGLRLHRFLQSKLKFYLDLHSFESKTRNKLRIKILYLMLSVINPLYYFKIHFLNLAKDPGLQMSTKDNLSPENLEHLRCLNRLYEDYASTMIEPTIEEEETDEGDAELDDSQPGLPRPEDKISRIFYQQVYQIISSAIKIYLAHIATLQQELDEIQPNSSISRLTNNKITALSKASDRYEQTNDIQQFRLDLAALLKDDSITQQRYWRGRFFKLASFGCFKTNSEKAVIETLQVIPQTA